MYHELWNTEDDVEGLLDGKVALVTGATRGIGRAIALRMAAQGASVVMTDLDPVELDDAPPVRGALLAHRGDVADAADAQGAVAAAHEAFGGLDAVVNVAGILGYHPVETVAVSEWDRLVAVHLGGTWNMLQAARPALAARGGGAFVAFTSGAALTGAGNMAGYATAKYAIVGLARSLADELAADGIRINAVSPTAVTRMLTATPGNWSAAPDEVDPRLGACEAEHVAPFVCQLVCDRGADVTGRVFLASGGYVIEYGPPRPYKQVEIPAPAGAEEIAQTLRWVLGRPAIDRIGYGPTRRFAIVEPTAHSGDA